MSILRILDSSGDTSYKWAVEDKASIAAVRERFQEVIKEGYQAFRIDSPTEGELIKEFDPEAAEIIMTAPMVGG